ncbi:Coiled-coil domain-containing protein 43 [Trichoplax sp. H2]|nr:Coiled-coil domain-containing protein 43 [Trichoplax sp. H2]|eukprot:RDD40992.1 Coiled-coil domain-containing protein 43 [Trichoplax sp. H2]
MASQFNEWLSHRLQAIGLDGEVMANYIIAALEQESDDKYECVLEILTDFTEQSMDELAKEIVDKWTESPSDDARLECSLSKTAEGSINIESALKSAISDIATVQIHERNVMDQKEKTVCERYGYESTGGAVERGSYPDLKGLLLQAIMNR